MKKLSIKIFEYFKRLSIKLFKALLKNKVLILGISFINFLLLVLNIYGLKDSWLFKINNKPLLNIQDFEEDYKSFVDFQALNQPLVNQKEINRVKNDKARKSFYLKNMLNDLLILKYAQENKIFNKKKLNRQIKNITNIIRRLMVKQIYIQKLILPNVKKLDDKLVSNYFKQLSKNKESKNWSIKKRKQEAEKQTKIRQLQKIYAEKIEKFRSKYRIKMNDVYLESLE